MGESIDIAAYLDSGVLELYVAGALSAEEAAEVHAMAQQYPAVQAEIEAIERSVMAYASHFGSPPAPDDQVLTGALAQIDAEADQAEASGVQPMYPKRRIRPWQIAAAVLLLVSLGVNLWLFFQWKHTDQRLSTLIAERNQIAEQRDQLRTRYDQADEMLAHLRAPASQQLVLNGTDLSPASRLTVVWNPESQRLLANGLDQLPTPKPGTQYQIWAIVDGQPVSAGVLTYQDQPQWGRTIAGQPGAFAVTLEPAGGSAAPTLDQMYVIGEV